MVNVHVPFRISLHFLSFALIENQYRESLPLLLHSSINCYKTNEEKYEGKSELIKENELFPVRAQDRFEPTDKR